MTIKLVEIAAILIIAFLLISWLLGRKSRLHEAGYYPIIANRSPEEWYGAHKEGADIMTASAYLEQRKSGRWLGADIVVDWHPGLDTDIDIHALDIEQNGASCGVYVRRVGNGQPLVRSWRLL